MVIPCEQTESDRDHLGTGSPSADLKNLRTVSAAQMNSVLVHTLHVADHNNYPL